MKRGGVVGAAGTVGAQAGFELALSGVLDELIYIDLLDEKAEGQALDTMQAITYESDTCVRRGGYEDAEDAQLFLVTAGRPREPGMTRLDLADANAPIVEEIFEKIEGVSPEAVTLMTTNPVDVMNRYAYEAGDRGRGKVIGFGGWLDSARFRYVLSKRTEVPPTEVEAIVLGEHGDSQVPIFSGVEVEGAEVKFGEEGKEEVRSSLRESSMEVIGKKGATEFAPARGLYHIARSILTDEEEVVPCSVVLQGEYGLEDVSLGVPCVLGDGGVKEVVEIKLTGEESEELRGAAEKLESAYAELDV